jgi:acyl carrier protein
MDIRSAVFDKIAESLKVDKDSLKDETTFSELGADSLDMVEFSLDLDDMFKINLTSDNIKEIKTLGQAISFIEKNKK